MTAAELHDLFPGAVVEKAIALGPQAARVPRYVAEYLAASAANQAELVERVLRAHHFGPEVEDSVMHRLEREGRVVLIDRLQARYDLESGQFFATLGCLGRQRLAVELSIPERYPRTLFGTGGAMELVAVRDSRRLEIKSFLPFEAGLPRWPAVVVGIKRVGPDQWRDLLLAGCGIDPAGLDERQKWWYVARLAPLVQDALHIVELGPPGTGKSYFAERCFSGSIRLRDDALSAPVLFSSRLARSPALVATYATVALDELERFDWNQPNLVASLSDYLREARLPYQDRPLAGGASFLFLANSNTEEKPFEQALPASLRNNGSLLDAVRGCIPGYELPRVEPKLLYRGPGLAADFLAAVFERLRAQRLGADLTSFVADSIPEHDRISVALWLSAFVKLLFAGDLEGARPHLAKLVEVAWELRERVAQAVSRLQDRAGEGSPTSPASAGDQGAARSGDSEVAAKAEQGPNGEASPGR